MVANGGGRGAPMGRRWRTSGASQGVERQMVYRTRSRKDPAGGARRLDGRLFGQGGEIGRQGCTHMHQPRREDRAVESRPPCCRCRRCSTFRLRRCAPARLSCLPSVTARPLYGRAYITSSLLNCYCTPLLPHPALSGLLFLLFPQPDKASLERVGVIAPKQIQRLRLYHGGQLELQLGLGCGAAAAAVG